MSLTSVRASSALISAVTVASLVGLAGPAMAQGGNPDPTPTTVGLDCSTLVAAPNVAVNYAGDAGCVGIRVSGPGLRLAWVVLNDGWTYVVKRNGTGTNGRVELRFTNADTGQKVTFRYERGKTVIS